MPRIGEMSQSPYLHFRDFKLDELQTGTIIKVERDPFYRNSRDWVLWFAEHPKPLKLHYGRLEAIARVLKSENTDDWIGQRIGFFHGANVIQGQHPGDEEITEGLYIDGRLPPQIQDVTPVKTLLEPQKAGLLIPHDAAVRFIDRLKGRGLRWSDFLTWAKRTDPDVYAAVHGKDLDTLPGSGLRAMTFYAEQFGAPDESAPASSPPPTAHTQYIPEEDIPF